MPLIMRDSVTPSAIPIAGTDIAVFYGDGTYADGSALKARFPHIPCLGVDVRGTMPSMQFRDWETGDKAGSLEQWVIDHNALSGKKDAVVYCNRSTIPEVRQLTGSQVLNKDYYLWVATLDGSLYTPQMLPGVVACQDKGSNQVHANYDESVVWFTPWTQRPKPSPGSAVVIDGFTVSKPSAGHVPAVVSWNGDAGVTRRLVNFSAADWQRIVG